MLGHELAEVEAQRDGYRRVSEEAMKLMTDEQLVALFERLDELDQGVNGERSDAGSAAVHSA